MIEPTMRLRHIIARTTTPLIVGALSGLLVLPLAAQQVPVKTNDIRKQLSQAGSGNVPSQPKPAPAASKKPMPPAAPAQNAPRPATKAASQAKATTSAKTAVSAEKAPAVQKTAASPANGAEVKTAADHESGPRRDPFEPLVGREKSGPAPEALPPGKAGLQVTTLRLDGIVRGPSGMIAVVSNAQQRVYFLRDGDRLYDGDVEHITMEGVAFHQTGTDPFGKPVEREVTKRLFPSPGDEK